MAAPKKKFDADAIMNSPAMKKAMKAAKDGEKSFRAAMSKGTVTGSKFNAPAPRKAKDSELKRSTGSTAKAVGYLKDRGKKRSADINRVIDEAG